MLPPFLRIAVIQRDTAEVKAKLKKLQEARKSPGDSEQQETLDDQVQNPVGQIPGIVTSFSQKT